MFLTRRRFILLISLISLSLTLIQFYYFGRIIIPSSLRELLKSSKKNNDGMVCSIPTLDPFNPEMVQILDTFRSIGDPAVEGLPSCLREDTKKFRIDLHGNLVVNEKGYLEKASCCYRSFQRDGDDMKVKFGEVCHPITNETTSLILYDFIHVNCKKKKNFRTSNKVDYNDAFPIIRRKIHVEKRSTEIEHTMLYKQPSVLIFGLDSVSHMNYQRYMPKTREFLLRNLSAIEYYGRNKVGESTFDNITPTLTGWRTNELITPEGAHCWPNYTYFDDCPFIWKDFAKKGYRTVYGEDAIPISTYLDSTLNGFKDPPTDYDIRTLFLGQEFLHYGFPGPCFTNQYSTRMLAEATAQIASVFRGSPYFQFFWNSLATHDVPKSARLADYPIYDLLVTLVKEDLISNLIIILMSDHGMTFGPFVETEQGMLESRMPMLNIIFPTWFKLKYQLAFQNVITNSQRLTTPFDLHEMLKDLTDLSKISDDSIKERSFQLQSKKDRGISLFLEIPKDQTCSSADIDDHWCICQELKEYFDDPSQNRIVQDASKYLIDVLNKKLSQFTECEALSLKNIKLAYEIKPRSNSLIKSGKSTMKLRITFQVYPSDGIFQSTIEQKHQSKGQWSLLGEISRINAYGNQGNCIDDNPKAPIHIKSICFCKNNTNSNLLNL